MAIEHFIGGVLPIIIIVGCVFVVVAWGECGHTHKCTACGLSVYAVVLLLFALMLKFNGH